MLFVTNRVFRQSNRSRTGRNVDFDLDDNNALQALFYCRRDGKDDYTEIGSRGFLDELRESSAEQVLIYVHGYSNLPEETIFPRAEALQQLFDECQANLVQVVPAIWPCDNDRGIVKDYYDDKVAADASGYAFARALERLRRWHLDNRGDAPQCLKRINLLAHSMGNRVLREAIQVWSRQLMRMEPPLVFRNMFLVAADIINESLEMGNDGALIPPASRNVLVYFAANDRALQASKVGNWQQASRRLGHTGPENMSRVARNVYGVDCEAVSDLYDPNWRHTYYLRDKGDQAGLVFQHICQAVKTGRVPSLGPEAEERITFLERPE